MNYNYFSQTLSNGNTIEYKEINGTAYHASTPDEVVTILENARRYGWRLRLWFGDVETGKAWDEEYDVLGTIGRSTGNIKIPLLIANKRSSGGGAILDHCLVKIQMVQGTKRVLYKHPTFHTSDFTISELTGEESCGEVNLKAEGYTHHTANGANFKSFTSAERYAKFMIGARMSK